MSARDNGETAVSPSGTTADLPPVLPARPSWEVAAPAPKPVAPPRPAFTPRPTPPRAPVDSADPSQPYYAAAPPAPSPPPTLPEAAAEAVQYDLAGNPVPVSGSSARASYSQASSAPVQAPATPGVWPPQPTTPYGAPGGGQFSENGTDRVARLRWNWGAFLLPFWWCCFNGQKNLAWVVLAINAGGRYIPAPLSYVFSVADLGIRIYLGLVGHRLSWASGRAMGDYDDFIRTQRAWMIWGFVVNVILVIGLAVLFATMAGLAGSLGGGFGHTGGSGSAPHSQGGN
jgi:hypothetical protein